MKGRTNIAGGASLNLDVKAYLSVDILPTTAKGNTIAVITDTDINGWVFSATEPTNPVEGVVWFKTGALSPTPFNALKKNGLWVYPTTCQQYINGAWVTKEAKTYQDGEWVMWMKALYWLGEFKSELTFAHNADNQGGLIEHENELEFYDNGDMQHSIWRFDELLDGSYKTLYVNVVSTTGGLDIKVCAETGVNSTVLVQKNMDKTPGLHAIDISNVTHGYIFIWIIVGKTVVNKIWLE